MANRAVDVVVENGKSPVGNGIILLAIAAFLIAVLWNGNLGDFWKQLKDDVFGASGQPKPHFWQWAIAVLILYYLSEDENLKEYTEPFFWIVIVALLISMAINHPNYLKNLTNTFNSIIGAN